LPGIIAATRASAVAQARRRNFRALGAAKQATAADDVMGAPRGEDGSSFKSRHASEKFKRAADVAIAAFVCHKADLHRPAEQGLPWRRSCRQFRLPK
jgi:hypothetical protein